MEWTPVLTLAGICWAACAAIMILVWLWAYKIRNAGVVDIFWAFNFTVIAGISYFLGEGMEFRRMLICGLIGLWSLRLGFYLLNRVGSHLKEEEGRYKALREGWAPNADRTFFGFFQMQAVSNIFLAFPVFLMSSNTDPNFYITELVGAILLFMAILGEGLSDYQLQAFKSDPVNKGKVCQRGFWNYSRHPNYFFQLMIWISVFVLAIASPWGILSIACPLSIGFLIFKVTGIPMTEEQALRSKGDLYREYQRTTSAFIPLPKRK